MGLIYNEKTGETKVIRERKWVSKEEALKMFPNQPERSKREDDIMYLKCGNCDDYHHIDDIYRCGALNSMET
jgi:hypothetical protein